MNRFQILWQLILADFRERTRRYSYLITLMVALFLGYLVLTGKYSYLFGSFKPVYNSAWVGTTMALAGAAMFTMMGFFVVRTSISRDRETGVGEILATTSLSNVSYLTAKFVSNLLVLWSMVAALTMIALIGMVANMPLDRIDFVAFILPFIIFPMIIMIPVAGAAILFDTVGWLRGSVGNVIYFFLAELMIVSGFLEIPYIDAAGMGLLNTSITGAIHSVYPGAKISMSMGFVGFVDNAIPAEAIKSFVWNGIDWTMPLLLSRLIWPVVAVLLLAPAVLLFDRFEQSKNRLKAKKTVGNETSPSKGVVSRRSPGRGLAYTSIPSVKPSPGTIPLIVAELKLGLKELKPIWYLIFLILIIGELFAPFDISRKYLLPAAMIWPLVLWSSTGTREIRFNMRSLLYCSAGVQTRQYGALMVAGIVPAAVVCVPMIVRAVITGDYLYSMLLISSALLLPSAAFAMGVVSGSRKLFEVTYLMVWYLGSIDHLTPIDLLGTTEASTSLTRVAVFMALAIVSAIIAYLGRLKRAEI